MTTKEQSLKRFLDKADEVIGGKYLFAIKKMEEMLRVVSSSKILFEVFEYCYNGENLEKLKAHYVTASSKGSFLMPESEKQSIALCFYIINQNGKSLLLVGCEYPPTLVCCGVCC